MIFGAIMMVVIGAYQVIMGLAAVIKHEFFVVTTNYVYRVNVTAWGWIHLAVGALVLIAGLFLFTGTTWARWVGILAAGLSAIDNFFFLPYYPVWSLLIIALDVFVIWSLAVVGSARRAERAMAATATAGGVGEPWPYANPPAEAASRDMGRPAAAPQSTAHPTETPGATGPQV